MKDGNQFSSRRFKEISSQASRAGKEKDLTSVEMTDLVIVCSDQDISRQKTCLIDLESIATHSSHKGHLPAI